MIEEDYVSYDIAKLLKEKWFNEPCWGYYVKSHVDHYFRPVKNSEWTSDKYSAPTLQMAMKWLREKYNIHIEPGYFPMPNIYRYVIIHSPVTIENISSHPQYFDTYEQACEAAIKYCLENLI